MSNSKPFTPPNPGNLMARYLQQKAEAHAAGVTDSALTGEVQPYEAGPVQPVEARKAWTEAQVVLSLAGLNQEKGMEKAPAGWAELVANQQPGFDLAMSVANFPQMVRNLQPLLQTKNLSELRSKNGNLRTENPIFLSWVDKVQRKGDFQQVLLAIGALRLAGQYEKAEELQKSCQENVPAEWQSFWANEVAALAWHRGDVQLARKMWQSQPDSVFKYFNLGMSALFVDEKAEAREYLQKACGMIPEKSAWHYLARLYLTLAGGE